MAGAPGNYSTRLTNKAPDKGSFPIDHESLCTDIMIDYLKCLRTNNFNNEPCRDISKGYLDCRMKNGLMAEEPWEKLGFKSEPTAETDTTTKTTTETKVTTQ